MWRIENSMDLHALSSSRYTLVPEREVPFAKKVLAESNVP